MAVSGLSIGTKLLSWVFLEVFSGSWSSGAHISFTNSWSRYLNFRQVFYFRFLSEFYFWSESTSGIAAKLRPPRTYDPRIMVEVVSVRLTLPERVTTGVGTSSWEPIRKSTL